MITSQNYILFECDEIKCHARSSTKRDPSITYDGCPHTDLREECGVDHCTALGTTRHKPRPLLCPTLTTTIRKQYCITSTTPFQ